MSVPPFNHLVDVVCLGIVIVGPAPLALLAAAFAGTSASLTHRVLATLIWWSAVQCSLGIALGVAGQLRLGPVLGCEIALALAGTIALRRQRPGASSWTTLIREQLFYGASHRVILLGTLLVAVTVVLLAGALVRPITEFDSLAYHLPQIAEWYQNGALVTLPNLRQIARYPFNWEMLEVLFVLPLGEDFAIALPNLCAWILLGLAVYRLARGLGAARLAALSGTALCMAIPDAAFQVRTSFVDVAQAALFTSALYLLCEQRRTRARAVVPTCLAASGMMLGIKVSALALAGLLIAVWGLLHVGRVSVGPRPHDAARRARTSPRALFFAGLAAAGWLGGFWYMRNWIQTSNPLGLVPLRLAGVELFPGDERYADLGRTSIARLFDLSSSSDWALLWQAVQARWGLPFFVMAAATAALPWALRQPQKHTRNALLLITVLTGIHILLYWYSPYTGDNGTQGWTITPWIANGLRYAMPLLASIAVLAALTATHVRPLSPLVWGGAVLSCAVLLFRLDGVGGLLVGLALSLVGSTLWIAGRHTGIPWAGRAAASRAVLGISVLLAAIVTLVAGSFARMQRDRQRDVTYRGVQSAIESVVPAGETVGYLMSLRSYVFYGRHLDRHVEFVPARDRSQHQWIQSMRDKDIHVVAIGPIRKQFMDRRELAWLRDEKGPFIRIFGSDPNDGSILFLVPD